MKKHCYFKSLDEVARCFLESDFPEKLILLQTVNFMICNNSNFNFYIAIL